MMIDELNAQQIDELKIRYLRILVDEGSYYAVVYDNPKLDALEVSPTEAELKRAAATLPDELIFRQWYGEVFDADEFSCCDVAA